MVDSLTFGNYHQKMKTIYREVGEIVKWIAFIRNTEGKAVEITIGKFPDWRPAWEAAKKRFGNKVILVEPK